MARIQKLIMKVPAVTSMVALTSMAAYFFPDLSDLAIYDRLAIQQGQFWRILTAPLAHFSFSHLACNLLPFLLFGAMLESFHRRSLLLVLGLTALSSGVIYVLFVPGLNYYGGLSGGLTGIVAYLGVVKINRKENSQHLWTVVLVLLFIKILIEIVENQPLFVSTEEAYFHVLPSSHLFGVSVAAIFFYFEQKERFTVIFSKKNLSFFHSRLKN